MRQDTVHLLRDCAAALEKNTAMIDSILPRVRDPDLRKQLRQGQRTQKKLLHTADTLLRENGSPLRSAGPLSAGMRQLQTDLRLRLGGDDTVAASLVSKGCDTGLRQLCRSRNRYIGADHAAMALAEQVIDSDADFSASLRSFL